MEELTTLLTFPPVQDDQGAAWAKLIQGDTLYQALARALRSPIAIDWEGLQRSLHQKWRQEYLESTYQPAPDTHKAAWGSVALLFWSAKEAATHSQRYAHAVDYKTLQTIALPTWLETNHPTAWGCIRSFLAPPLAQATLFVALTNKDESDGWIAELTLETVASGAQCLCRHPRDHFGIKVGEQFLAALDDAWKAAIALATREGHEVAELGATWALSGEHLPPFIEGRSAGGAAARGWSYLLAGRIPDRGLIALADIHADGLLVKVGGVPIKTAKVIEYSRTQKDWARQIDTVVVADADNAREAEGKIKEMGASDLVRVVDLSQPSS